jgi:hypothetical protein
MDLDFVVDPQIGFTPRLDFKGAMDDPVARGLIGQSDGGASMALLGRARDLTCEGYVGDLRVARAWSWRECGV